VRPTDSARVETVGAVVVVELTFRLLFALAYLWAIGMAVRERRTKGRAR